MPKSIIHPSASSTPTPITPEQQPEPETTLEQAIADRLLETLDYGAIAKALITAIPRRLVSWMRSGGSAGALDVPVSLFPELTATEDKGGDRDVA